MLSNPYFIAYATCRIVSEVLNFALHILQSGLAQQRLNHYSPNLRRAAPSQVEGRGSSLFDYIYKTCLIRSRRYLFHECRLRPVIAT